MGTYYETGRLTEETTEAQREEFICSRTSSRHQSEFRLNAVQLCFFFLNPTKLFFNRKKKSVGEVLLVGQELG